MAGSVPNEDGALQSMPRYDRSRAALEDSEICFAIAAAIHD
jgi:hypothetical protein